MQSEKIEITKKEKKIIKNIISSLKFPADINEDLLFNALCHTSYVYDKENKHRNLESNERLEFLGDSVLALVISEFLFKNYNLSEGDMSKVRATVASELILSEVASDIGLNSFIFLGNGENKHGGRKKHSILADALESLIASIYLSQGYDFAYKFIIENLYEYIIKAIEGKLFLDYKTRLQEITQEYFKELPKYNILEVKGPSHVRYYKISVEITGENYGVGEGHSKKIAAQLAAKKACENLILEHNNKRLK